MTEEEQGKIIAATIRLSHSINNELDDLVRLWNRESTSSKKKLSKSVLLRHLVANFLNNPKDYLEIFDKISVAANTDETTCVVSFNINELAHQIEDILLEYNRKDLKKKKVMRSSLLRFLIVDFLSKKDLQADQLLKIQSTF
jgi:hypothetical protein